MTSASRTKYRDIKWTLLPLYCVARRSYSPAMLVPRALSSGKIASFYIPRYLMREALVPPAYGLHISLRQFFQWADSRRTVVLCPAAPGLNPVGMIAPCQGRQALDSYVKPRELCKSDRFGARWGNFPGFSSRKSVVLTGLSGCLAFKPGPVALATSFRPSGTLDINIS